MNLPPVIAHRGACGYAPENTLASFRKAKEVGALWVEFDVMLAACGEAIVIHDETIDRTTNGRGLVAEHTYKELETLDAGEWFAPEFKGEKIPRFIDVIDCLSECGLGANVEIKASMGQEVPTAIKAVDIIQSHWPSHLPTPLITSYSIDSMRYVKDNIRHASLGLLSSRLQGNWLDLARELGAQTVHVSHRNLTKKRVESIVSEGYKVLAYTVNEARLASKLFSWGVSSVFSNFPDKVINL